MTQRRAFAYGTIAFAMALLDGAFKIAAQQFAPDTSELAWPIALALHKNFGILANAPVPLVIVIPLTIIICGILTNIVVRYRATAPHMSLAGWILLSGALSNLIDRIINGYTTDYLIFFRHSAVNIADGLILMGAVLIAWYSKDSSRNVH